VTLTGFNIAIIAALLSQTLGRLLGKRWALYPTLGAIAVYALLVGADSAVVRAAIMGGLFVVAQHLGRQNTAYVSLSVASLVMTAVNPLALWDVGFQLSFMATLGMILFSPMLARWLERLLARFLPPEPRQSALSLLNEILICTLAAQITVVPIIAAYFGRLSLISLLVNPLILPVQPPIMIWGGIATLAGLAWLPLGHLLAAVPWLFLAYTTTVVQGFARLPFASLDIGMMSRVVAVVYYALLFGGIALRHVWPRLGLATRRCAGRALATAVVLVIPLWLGTAMLRSWPDGQLHVWLVGLGDGDATVIQAPSGQRVLVDVGRGEASPAAAVGGVLPGRNRLDLLLLTRGDEEHTAPLPGLLDRWHVAQTLVPADLLTGAGSDSVADSALAAGSRMGALTRGMRIQIDDGVLLEVLHVPEATEVEDGAVLRLTYGDLRLLLPSEIEQQTQAELLASGHALPSTVLKTPHMGTGNWPTTEFLATVRPQTVLVPDNTTYPPAVQAALGSLGMIEIDPEETVELRSDGQRLWLYRRSPSIWSRQ
jgi:competence protein ComEC